MDEIRIGIAGLGNRAMWYKRAPVIVNPALLHPQERRQSLDGAWEFRLDPDDVGLQQRWFDLDGFADPIQVPGTWQGQGFGSDEKETVWDFRLEARIYRATYTGAGWYAKRFYLPDHWQPLRTWINFGGVHPSAEVWLNGVKLGENEAPFVPFGFEITGLISTNRKNVLVVRVHEKNRLLGLAYNWQGHWSGLYRSVELTATGPNFLERLWIHPDVDKESLRFHARIGDSASSPANQTVQVTVQPVGSDAPLVTTEASVTPGDNTFELSLPAPKLWSPDTPNLYRVDAVLTVGAEVMDCVSERVGFVKLSADGKQFRINDEPYYMRGSCDHHSSPLTGCPDWNRDRWRKNLATLREYGYNWIRLVDVYNPEYYDAADEVGMLVQSDMGMLGAWGGLNPWHVYQWPQPMPDLREAMKWQWDHTVMRDVNHPSANLYCMSNEFGWNGTVPRNTTEHPRTAWQCYHDTKAIKPSALVLWTDGGYNVQMPQDYVNHDADYVDKTDKPVIQHEFRWWSSFPDVRLMDRFTGAMRPYAQQIATEAADRHGIAHVLPRAAVSSQRLQYVEMKGKMESLRRDNPLLAGVEHTNAVDLIPSPQGIVDIFYQRKYADAAMWRQTMGDTVLLSSLDFDSRVLVGGQDARVHLFVSDYAHPPFDNPVLKWRFMAGSTEAGAGQIQLAHQPYRTCPAGVVELAVPEVSTPAEALLQTTLQDGQRVISNQWDLWLFPPSPPLPSSLAVYGRPRHTWLVGIDELPAVEPAVVTSSVEARALLTERIDRALIDYARAGGRIIFAASEGLVRPSFAKLDSQDHYYFTPPANYPPYEDGQNGTIIADHPLLGDFPHQGFADLQFFRMIRQSPPLDLESLALNDGDPVIRVLHCYPAFRPLAYLIECSLGRGTVIICALDLNQSLPEARYLLAQICKHAVSGAPKPMMELPDAALERFLSASSIP